MEKSKNNLIKQIKEDMTDISSKNNLAYEGYLEKKARNLFAGWQKRYFIIIEGKLIIYTESKESKLVKGYIPIKQIADIKSLQENTFSIDVEGRKIILRAENENIKNKWIETIKNSFVIAKRGSFKLNDASGRNRTFDIILKANEKIKLNTINKKYGNLIKKHGYIINKEDALSKNLLEKFGINSLINLNDPKILTNIKYGFMYKKQKNHNIYNKRWLFIISRCSLFNNDNNNNEDEFLDDKKLKGWIKFDFLYYFKQDENESNNIDNVYDAEISMEECRKIIHFEKDDKFFLNFDSGKRIYEFYCESKLERDEWFEALLNSRKTAKIYKYSITKHPKNIDNLYSLYTKDKLSFMNKIKEEKDAIIGNTDKIKEFNIFEFTINNLQNLILSTMDGCICGLPVKTELLKAYAEHMNQELLNIIQNFWEKSYNLIRKEDIIRMGVLLLIYNDKISKFNIIDINILKNGKEFVKIYFKNVLPNILFTIENILKYMIEHKGSKDEKGIYYSESPKLLFDIFYKLFDFLKEFKYPIIFKLFLKLLNVSIFQFCVGVNYIISNPGIIIEDEYLITISNDTFILRQFINDFIENLIKLNVLNQKEINEEFEMEKIINLIDKICFNSVVHLVYEHKELLEKEFEDQKFLKMEIDKIIKNSFIIYGKYKSMLNDRIVKIFYKELLKFTLCFYIINLLLLKHKSKTKKEDIINKIKNDKKIFIDHYKEVIGENLSIATLKILDSIIVLLEIDQNIISTTILEIRQYIGPAFTYAVAENLIKLRSDLKEQEIKECKKQVEEILNEYEGPKGESSSYFQILSYKIKRNNKDKDYLMLKESRIKFGNDIKDNDIEENVDKIDSDNDSGNNDSGIEEKFEKMRVNFLANEKFCLRASLRTFLNDNESDDENEDEEEEEENEIKEDIEEDSKVELEGFIYKKKIGIYKKYFFQIKNCGLYLFEERNSKIPIDKFPLKNVIIKNNEKELNKFLLIANEKGNQIEYNFKCDTDEIKNSVIRTMKKSINEENNKKDTLKLEKIEFKERKKIIKDLPKIVDNKFNNIEDKILEYLKTGKYFKLNEKKMEREIKNNIKKKKEEKLKEENLSSNDENHKLKKSRKSKVKNWIKDKVHIFKK